MGENGTYIIANRISCFTQATHCNKDREIHMKAATQSRYCEQTIPSLYAGVGGLCTFAGGSPLTLSSFIFCSSFNPSSYSHFVETLERRRSLGPSIWRSSDRSEGWWSSPVSRRGCGVKGRGGVGFSSCWIWRTIFRSVSVPPVDGH
ncbi:hypothetical protein YC2023_031553 [Brassica napus]